MNNKIIKNKNTDVSVILSDDKSEDKFEDLLILSVRRNPRLVNCIVSFEILNNSGINQEIEFNPDIILKYSIQKGIRLTAEEFKIIQSEQKIIEVKRRAWNFASYKPRTESEIRRKLLGLKFTISEITVALDFLKEFKLVDDEKYCKIFSNDYLKKKPSGSNRVILELMKRGIGKELARNSTDEIFSNMNERDLALDSARNKFNKVTYKPLDKQISAVGGHLQRQGFSWESIRYALEIVFEKLKKIQDIEEIGV